MRPPAPPIPSTAIPIIVLFLLAFIVPICAVGLDVFIQFDIGMQHVDGAEDSPLTRGDRLMLWIADCLPWAGVVCGLTLAICAAVLIRRQRRLDRRMRLGQCVRCGLDLHAAPDRWPECGLVPAPPKKEAV
ncbi:MAG TPA: hypothetical protein VMD30_03645 [Tepidisphaeraceae bacterium]|nr:hypothetical protein [Tepidisphaeraceae bacterium]